MARRDYLWIGGDWRWCEFTDDGKIVVLDPLVPPRRMTLWERVVSFLKSL